MCGIAGGWLFESGVHVLDISLAALAHRGPDSCGTYLDPDSGVALGHARLAIIDLSSTGHQPMFSADGNVALTFNGEIYNYRELRVELEAGGVTFFGQSDTEVVLQLYLKYGIEMLPRLNGIFAFAIHDRRSSELLLARDALGVKPLYFSEGRHGFAFASEIKALLPLLKEVGPLDHDALHRYLSYLYCPGDGTPLSGVRKLLPGEAIVVKQGRILRRWTWYELPARRGIVGRLEEAEAIKAIREGLRLAVHRQLMADVPVGAFLSGGLDSSAIVAFAREQISDLRCFTIESSGGGDAGDGDDLPYAKQVARHLGVPLEIVKVDAARMAGDLEQMVWQLDEPIADPASLNVLYISQLARQQGIKVLLSGAGGDDLFTGYRRHLAMRYEAWWSWLPQAARRGLGNISTHFDRRTALGRRMGFLFGRAAEQGDARLASFFTWTQPDDLIPLYSSEMKATISEHRVDQPLLDFLAGIPEAPSRLERMLALEQRFYVPDLNLIYFDKMSMATGVEVRVPFLDLELVELASRVPDRFKQNGLASKWVLKKAMEPYLPHKVIYRPKTGFGAPLRRWMRHELRDFLGDLLSEQSVRRRGLFEPAAVQQVISDNDSGRRDAAYTLFSMLCIEIWCRRFIDQAPQ